MFLYNISGLVFRLNGSLHGSVLTSMEPYKVNHTNILPDVTIDVKLCDEPLSLPDEPCVSISDTELWHVSQDKLTYYLIFPDISGAAVCAECNKDFSTINICSYDVKTQLGYDDSCYLFNTLSNIMHYIALMHGRIVFHSSSICVNGEGVAFSADSGVGKSTHTSLWLENINGVSYINDDTPIITCLDENIMISGTPFAGTSDINNNITVPLRAIVFVTRGKENKLVQVDTLTAFSRIMSQLKKPVTDEMTSKMIDNLSAILKVVPCYLMECNISPEAAFEAYNAVFNK